MKANEELQSHGNGKISTLLRNVSQIVLMGAAALFLYFLILLAVVVMRPNPCGSDDAIDMYGCHPDGSM